MIYDVIIIGGGAAGLSAALWCDELGLTTLLLEARAELGGQLLRVYNPIKNHLGIETANGRELRDIFAEQVEKRAFEIRLQATITKTNFLEKSVSLESGETIFANSIIIAAGVRRRKLNVAGEDEFVGRGIIESGRRDAATVENKMVAVVGGGDAAFENALILAETAANVALFHRQKNFRARAEFIEQVRKHPKIQISAATIVRKINGNERVENVELENLETGEIYRQNIEAIVIRAGVEPNTDFLDGQLETDAQGYITTNQNCQTNLEGIYAVGDVANPLAPTVSGAVGAGATAAKTITNFKLRITNEN